MAEFDRVSLRGSELQQTALQSALAKCAETQADFAQAFAELRALVLKQEGELMRLHTANAEKNQ